MEPGKLSWCITAFGVQMKITLCAVQLSGGEIERQYTLIPEGYFMFDVVITDTLYDTIS